MKKQLLKVELAVWVILTTVLGQDLATADHVERAVAAGLARLSKGEVLEYSWDLVLGVDGQADGH